MSKPAYDWRLVPMSSAALQDQQLLPCPRCGDLAPLWANFCGMCTYMHNPEGYFKWLANRKAE